MVDAHCGIDFRTPYSGAVDEEARLELPVWLMTGRPTAETGSIHGMFSGGTSGRLRYAGAIVVDSFELFATE